MIVQDLINGGFELFSGLFQVLNILKLYKDKELKGVSWIPTLVFTLWGFWNLYYYPFLGQWLSFVGGIVIFTTNLVWVGLVFYYHKRRKI